MNEDFLDAHERHWEDAQCLYSLKRWANADHLYGLSAECGLKGLTEKIKGSSLGPGQRRHIMQANKTLNAWDIFESYRSGSSLGAKFHLPASNPFTDWDVCQRYANQSHFNQAVVDQHRLGAQLVMELVIAAELEGLL